MRYGSRPILAICFALLLALGALSSAAVADVDCFRWADNRKLQFDVFQVGAPPRDNEPTQAWEDFGSPVLPASDFVTKSVGALNAVRTSEQGISFRKHYLLWANRCIFINGVTPTREDCRNVSRTKGNGYPSMALGATLSDQLRAAFSTYAKANACTILNAMKVLGEDQATLAAKARAANIALMTRPDHGELNRLAQSVQVGRGQPARYVVDICVVESQAIARDVAGILVDYEVFDGRTPAETLGFLRELKRVAAQHGKTLIVGTNPLPRPPNGIGETNIREILEVVDGFAVPITSGGSPGNTASEVPTRARRQSPVDDYRHQLAIITGNAPLEDRLRRKLLWNMSIYDLHPAEARELHETFRAQGYRGIMIFRNYVKTGGACSRPENQTIACLAFGDCDGRFGSDRPGN
jgi:hypothetical protein